MIDPSKAALFIPPGLKDFKLRLFDRIGNKVGRVVRHDFDALAKLPADIIPIVGCTRERLRFCVHVPKTAGNVKHQ